MSDNDYDLDYDDNIDYDEGIGSGSDIFNGGETRRVSYEILTKSKLLSDSNDTIKEVKVFLNLPNEIVAELLLKQFKWNKEKLIDSYFANPKEIIEKSGACLELEIPPKSQNKKSYECPICYLGYPGKETFALGCAHRYCKGCWECYLQTALQNNPNATEVRCMYPNCKLIVHKLAWEKLCSRQVYEKYLSFLLKSLVIENPLIKFCPAPGCAYSIKVTSKDRLKPVNCSCGFSWCFQCADYDIGDHTPATCENVREWLQRASAESENIKWLIANTKLCPKCHNPIEKNGGCMHMTCRNCKQEFCWLCRGPWNEHGNETGGFYACNKYTFSEAKKEDEKAKEVRTELEHYMFYYHRYESHRLAMKSIIENKGRIDNRINDLVNYFGVRTQDIMFLYDTANQLIENCRVLLWSYVYGFYIKNQRELTLFQFLQEDLEKFHVALMRLYEKEFRRITNFVQWKSDVTNNTRVTKNYLEKFVDGVMIGL